MEKWFRTFVLVGAIFILGYTLRDVNKKLENITNITHEHYENMKIKEYMRDEMEKMKMNYIKWLLANAKEKKDANGTETRTDPEIGEAIDDLLEEYCFGEDCDLEVTDYCKDEDCHLDETKLLPKENNTKPKSSQDFKKYFD